jgi:hypothetical protein
MDTEQHFSLPDLHDFTIYFLVVHVGQSQVTMEVE